MEKRRKNLSGVLPKLLLLIFIIANLFCISTLGAEEYWSCENCSTLNAPENNFCGNCGSARPASKWSCPGCGKENDAENNFCVNCGTKKSAESSGTADIPASSSEQSYAYGQQMLYWEGYTYVTGDDGIYRIDSANQFERIMGNDSIANGFFALDRTVYFMKYDSEDGGCFLYSYDIDRNEHDILCTAGDNSRLIGADKNAVYFLQPSEDSYGEEKNLIRYHLASDEKETVASAIGTAQFWNGGIVITGAASDVSPVQLMVLGADGVTVLVGENCSQSFYIDGDTLYYIKYNMTSEYAWDKAYLCSFDQAESKEMLCIEGDYVTPSIINMVSEYVVLFFYQDGKSQYIQVNSTDNSWGEMELPGDAAFVDIFKDEYGNRYYYANNTVYIWKGSEYREVADISPDGIMLGVSGRYAYCWHYHEGHHPSLFQYPIS